MLSLCKNIFRILTFLETILLFLLLSQCIIESPWIWLLLLFYADICKLDWCSRLESLNTLEVLYSIEFVSKASSLHDLRFFVWFCHVHLFELVHSSWIFSAELRRLGNALTFCVFKYRDDEIHELSFCIIAVICNWHCSRSITQDIKISATFWRHRC